MQTVVHIDTARSWRGGQLQVFLLHGELLKLGLGSRLIARAGGALHRRCVDAGLPVDPVSVLRPWYPPALAVVRRLTRSASIIHAHDSHALSLAALARVARPEVALVCHRRNAYPLSEASVWRHKYRSVDLWIAVSSEIADALRRAGVDHHRVVPSAIDVDGLREAEAADLGRLRTELGIPEQSPVIGLVGALTSQKGHRVLLAAAAEITAANPGAVFVCVGEGPLRSGLERRARGLGGAVIFTGFRHDVPALMTLFSVLVAPSLDGEGSSAVIKEAIALGTPVVASDLPGNREVLGDAGILVPVGGYQALALAVTGLLDEPVHRSELADLGRACVERFGPEAMTKAVIEGYASLGLRVAIAPEAA
jgi:glycosyltransferase involved in cell wall biosynthesis